LVIARQIRATYRNPNQDILTVCRHQAFFCKEAPTEAERSADDLKHFGQFFPSQQALGSNQPVCPPNATRLVQEEDRKHVKEGMEALGEQIGVVLTECEQRVELLTHYPDGTFRRWYLEDPSGLKVVLASCAAELEKIPEVPTFEDRHLAIAAASAFEKGYEAGADQVANRLLVLELAIDAIEMIVFPELFVAEVAATRAIRTAMSGLRRMPIFVPGAVNGIGVFMKVAPKAVVKTVARGSSRVLARAMKAVGKFRLAGEFCHHIVAHGDARAKAALDVLDKFGIGVDEAVNGVFLPGFKTSPNPLKKAVHGNLHTKKYYEAVNKMLDEATSPADARRVLKEIAENLEKGIVPK